MRYHGMTAATGLAVCCALLLMATAAVAADEMKGDPYPLGTCPVTGEKLGAMGSPIVKVYDGREIRFCCGGCPAKFEADKAEKLTFTMAELATAKSELEKLKAEKVETEIKAFSARLIEKAPSTAHQRTP